MSGRPHLSIGDVLSLLRQEFSDVTISKIRFLESQGLIDPERSASGYRKFYEEDVERLRWVLRKQRDQFLPLKVIRDRLAAAGSGVPPDDEPSVSVPEPETHERTSPEIARRPAASGAANGMAAVRATRDVLSAPAAPPPEVEKTPAHAAGPEGAVGSGRERDTGRAARVITPGRSASGVNMTREELCAATGLDDDGVSALESVGLVSSITLGGGRFYDDEAVAICKLAGEFGHFGIEARHLRVFRNASEREVDLIEQVVTPLLRQRNPESHRRALETAQELARLGQSLRASLVRSALHRQLGA